MLLQKLSYGRLKRASYRIGVHQERRLGYHTNGLTLATTRRLAQRVLNVEHPNLGELLVLALRTPGFR
jgi:hypothetical protein